MKKITDCYGMWHMTKCYRMECHEYIPCGDWEEEWVDNIPDDAVSYTIYDPSGNEYDGGVFGFNHGDTIDKFNAWLEFAHGLAMVEMIDTTCDAIIEAGDAKRFDEIYPTRVCDEWCGNCNCEVVIPAYHASKCPVCNEPILPCSMCETCPPIGGCPYDL